jgi:hypothetical protein
MPDAQGNLKGQGWSRKREEGWERAFGRNPSASGTIPCESCPNPAACFGWRYCDLEFPRD